MESTLVMRILIVVELMVFVLEVFVVLVEVTILFFSRLLVLVTILFFSRLFFLVWVLTLEMVLRRKLLLVMILVILLVVLEIGVLTWVLIQVNLSQVCVQFWREVVNKRMLVAWIGCLETVRICRSDYLRSRACSKDTILMEPSLRNRTLNLLEMRRNTTINRGT